MAYRLIVFDVDGTLIDSKKTTFLSLKRLLEENNIKNITPEQFETAFTMTSLAALRYFGVKDVEGALLKWNDYIIHYKDHLILFDGIYKIIDYLKRNGYHLGIVTSRKEYEMKIDPAMKEIESYFEAIVCADHTNNHKPHPEPMEKMIKITGFSPNDILFVGDSMFDCLCAEASGVDFAAALWCPSQIDTLKCKYLIHHPEELIRIL